MAFDSWRAARSDRHLRPGWHALRIQVSVGAADRSRTSTTAFGTTARLGNHHPDPSDRRNSRSGIVQSKAQPASDGRLCGTCRVSICEPGYRDRCLAGGEPEQRSAGSRSSHGFSPATGSPCWFPGQAACSSQRTQGGSRPMPQWLRCSVWDYWCFCWVPNRRSRRKLHTAAGSGWHAIRHAFSTAVIGPFRDFMHRPLWPVILIAIFGYKLGEAMAGVMSTPLYISLGFSLPEIAAASKVFGFFSIVAGALIGGVVTTRFGIRRSLILVRYFAVGREPVFCSAGCRRTSDRLPCFMCHCRKSHGWDGRDRVGDLSFQSMLARFYGDSVRAACLACFAWPHRGGLLRRSFVREDRLGTVLPAYQRRRIASPSFFSSGSDRATISGIANSSRPLKAQMAG